MRPGWSVWRGVASSNCATIQRGEMKQKITQLGYKQPPTDIGPHNNQLNIGGHGGGNIGEEVHPGVIAWRM